MRLSWRATLVVAVMALVAASALVTSDEEPMIERTLEGRPYDDETMTDDLDDDQREGESKDSDVSQGSNRNLDYEEPRQSSLDLEVGPEVEDDLDSDDGYSARSGKADIQYDSPRSSVDTDDEDSVADETIDDDHFGEADGGSREPLLAARSAAPREAAWKSGLSDREIEVIKSTWQFVSEDTVTSGLKLFRSLFTRFPQYMKLFKFTDLDLSSIEAMRKNKKLVNHVTKVITTISFVVDTLGDDSRTQERVTALTNLIKAHKKRSVGYEQFKNLGGVVIDTVVQINEDAGAPQDRIKEAIPAWTKFYASILKLVRRQSG